MEFLQQLKSIHPPQENIPSMQVRRAISNLRTAKKHSHDVSPHHRHIFEDQIEKMCADLGLWIESINAGKIH